MLSVKEYFPIACMGEARTFSSKTSRAKPTVDYSRYFFDWSPIVTADPRQTNRLMIDHAPVPEISTRKLLRDTTDVNAGFSSIGIQHRLDQKSGRRNNGHMVYNSYFDSVHVEAPA